MGHVSNKPDQQRHFMPLSMPVRNISELQKAMSPATKKAGDISVIIFGNLL